MFLTLDRKTHVRKWDLLCGGGWGGSKRGLQPKTLTACLVSIAHGSAVGCGGRVGPAGREGLQLAADDLTPEDPGATVAMITQPCFVMILQCPVLPEVTPPTAACELLV